MSAVSSRLMVQPKAADPSVEPGSRRFPKSKGNGAKIAVGALVGLLLGAGGGYQLASLYFSDQFAAVTQAADLRVKAANQRIQEVEQQQREIVQQADEQLSEITQQASDQQRALLEQANEKERKLAKPDLPVRVWVRRAFVGGGMVAMMHNFGNKELALAVTAHSGATNQQYAWNIVLAPNATQEIGNDQGWAFAAGDELELSESGFRPMSFHVRPRAKQPPGQTPNH